LISRYALLVAHTWKSKAEHDDEDENDEDCINENKILVRRITAISLVNSILCGSNSDS